jgi:thiol:disulfide interchange protein DsbC
MKKLVTMSVTASMILASVAAGNLFAEDANVTAPKQEKAQAQKKVRVGDVSPEEASKLVEKFNFISKNPGMRFVKGQKLDKFVQLMFEAPNGQRFEAIVIPDSDYIIVGRVFDSSGSPQLLPADMAKVEEGAAFKIGSGPKTVYLVTDPECPYCRDLEERMSKNEKLESEYTVKIIPMPLSFHKNARQMFRYILAGKDDQERAKRMREVMSGKDSAWKEFKPSDEERRKLDEIIDRGIEAAKELGARGTPSTFDEKGNQISPFVLLSEDQRPKPPRP